MLIYAAAPNLWFELAERPAAGRSLPEGERVTVRGVTGVFTTDEGRDQTGKERRDVLSWIERGTYVELHTTLDRTAALHAVRDLEVTLLPGADLSAR